MTRKISVLFVGTSAMRGSAAQQVLAAHGYDVSFEMPFAGVNGTNAGMCSIGNHDVIAFDASAGDTPGGDDLIIIDGRGSPDEAPRSQARIRDLETLPDAVVRLLNGREVRDTHAVEAEAASIVQLRELLAGLPGVVFRCGLDNTGHVTFMNERVTDLCGYRQSHFVGHNSERLLALVHPADRRKVMTALQRTLRDGEPYVLEHRIICAGGEERWLWHRGCVYTQRRETPELEAFVVDITDRKAEEQQLAYLANHDALTGVANRSMFIEQLASSVRRADRHGEMVACLFLDVDRFKRVNDSFGHAFGDELLQQVSERLKRCIRGNDLIGRLGGDEFTVLLDGIAEPQDASAAAQKILDELLKPYVIRGRRLTVSASIGVSCYPGDASDCTALLRNADAAMYSVKSSGRRGFRFYSAEMSSQAFQTLSLTNGLRNAIESNGLNLSYQPRVNLRTGRVSCLEVLTRWESAEFGKVAPSRFIALAEDVGLIAPLGEWVLREACSQATRWDRQGLPATRISVNLSPRQFRDDHIVEQIATVLNETGLPAERLELEITEGTMMQDHVVAAETLRQLKELGVKLSVDDFGTGYSSLHLLKKFPLDYLKVDSSFISGVPDDEDDVAITEAIIVMAKRLNLGVVAEGIETEAQGIFVRSSGCDEGQGYLFSRPVAEVEVRQYLDRRVH